VFVVDGDAFKEVGFIPTGVGTHGLYPSRDGKKLYVINRGTARVYGPPRGKGSIAVLDFATRSIEANLEDPGRRQPGHGQCERGRQAAVGVRPLR
jgi:DNA-binding beta-propeller fold protein YncE